MLDQNTKRKIDNTRQILVGKIPDPKAQVEQITIALVYKFMDDMDKESEELGGKARFFSNGFSQFSWSKLLDQKLSGQERFNLYVQAISSMSNNKNIPQLFRDIFKGAFLPYNDPRTLSLFLKEINEFSYEHSEDLGDSFEYLLSVLGSQGDAGQFRTPRHIIDFIVEAVDPKKNEKILDPACGTAGFLISAYKHILKQNKSKPLTPDEKQKLMHNLAGYDISPDMVKLALVNMYLHGFPEPKIYEYDTLSDERRWDEYADVILANPPFMTPKGGIQPHKRFSVPSNRSEVLFVDYIAEHLSQNGRAGIIVPEGIIFQSAGAYKQLRKYLIENNYLWAVVSLPAGVFNPYSGVKTSILLLDKTIAKMTDNILFVKVENDGLDLGAQRREIEKNDLPEALNILIQYKESVNSKKLFASENKNVFVLSISKIREKEDYILSIDRYRENGNLKQSHFEFIKLGDVVEILDNKRKPITKSDRKPGPFPYYGATGIVDYVQDYLFDERLVLVGEDGAKWDAGEKTAFIIEGKTWVNNHAHVLRPSSKILAIYLVEVLNMLDLNQFITGVTVPKLNQEKLRNIEIPLPPIEVQEQIVSKIEGWQKIIDGAKQVVENYKPQIEIDTSWELVEIGNICELATGGTPRSTNPDFYGGDIKWLVSGDIHKGEIYDCDGRITEMGMNDSNAKYLPINSVLIALNGQGKTRASVAILKTKATCNQSLVSINPKDNKQLIPEFLYYQLKSMYQQIRNITGDNERSGLSMKIIREIKILVPSLEIQKNNVERIEQELALVRSTNQLIQTFEQKIKDEIGKLWKQESKNDTMGEDKLLKVVGK